MSVLYVAEQGAKLCKKGERIIVENNGSLALDIAFADVEHVSVLGNVQMSSQLMNSLMRKDIGISHFTSTGNFIGQTSCSHSKDVFIRMEQYATYENRKRRLENAAAIVRGKIFNQINCLQSYRATDREAIKQSIKQIEKASHLIDSRSMADDLMGIEGYCSRVYFDAFRKLLKCKCECGSRSRRPPKDPVNALLSLGYTLLMKDVACALESNSLELYVGFLHALKYGRKSLVLDAMEQFRQPIIDRMVVRVLNKRMINENHFIGGATGNLLTEEGLKKFCRLYEETLRDASLTETDEPYKEIIRRQAALLKKSIRKGFAYRPYIMKIGKEGANANCVI